MIIFLAPEGPESQSMASRRAFRWADQLTREGIAASAFQLHPRQASLASLTNLGLRSNRDLLVLTAEYGELVRLMHEELSRVVIDDDPVGLFKSLSDITRHPYRGNDRLVGVVTMDSRSAELLEHGFGVDVHVVRAALDKQFECGSFPRQRRIVFDGEANVDHLLAVIGTLSARGDLANWDIARVDTLPAAQRARELATAAIYLNSDPSPVAGGIVAEAVACGSAVVGYEVGDTELNQHIRGVAFGDLVGLSKRLVKAMAESRNPTEKQRLRTASKKVRALYSGKSERTALVEVFAPLAEAVALREVPSFGSGLLVRSDAAKLLAGSA